MTVSTSPQPVLPADGLPVDHPGRRRLPALLRRSWYGLNQAFRRRIAELELTPNQFTILRWLDEAGEVGLNQTQLCDRMASDQNTIASLVERMQKSGMIERRVDPDDRRARRVWATDLGRQRYAEARPMAVDLQARVLSVLPEDEREPFLRRLEAVASACQAELDGGGGTDA